jgi:amino acid ABC transporter ATP-binding protein, PAAT family (TC 3.A.1.3.-)
MRWDLQVEVATRVLFIDEGQVKESNTPQEFFENPQHPRLKEFLSKVVIKQLKSEENREAGKIVRRVENA